MWKRSEKIGDPFGKLEVGLFTFHLLTAPERLSICTRSLLNLCGDPPSCTSGVPHPAALIVVILLHRFLHWRCACLKGAPVHGVDLRNVDVHMGRNWRPTLPAIRQHHYRIVDTDLGMQDFTGRIGKPTQFDRTKDMYEEVDRLAGPVDDKVR